MHRRPQRAVKLGTTKVKVAFIQTRQVGYLGTQELRTIVNTKAKSFYNQAIKRAIVFAICVIKSNKDIDFTT